MKSLTYDHGVILLATVIAHRNLISPAQIKISYRIYYIGMKTLNSILKWIRRPKMGF